MRRTCRPCRCDPARATSRPFSNPPVLAAAAVSSSGRSGAPQSLWYHDRSATPKGSCSTARRTALRSCPLSTTVSRSSPISSCAATRRARIDELVEGLDRGDRHQVLLGVTGSGKTFTMAQVIARVNRADARDGRTTRRWPRSSTRSSGASSRRTPSSTSSATTTTTSPRPTSRPPTPTSRRKPRSTTRSTGCACRPRGRSSSGATSSSSPACRASTASARRRRTTACCCRSSAGSGSTATRSCASWSRSSTSATIIEFGRGTLPRARRRRRGLPVATKSTALRIELFGDEVDELVIVRSADGQGAAPARQGRRSIPKSHFVTPRDRTQAAPSRRSRRSSREYRVEARRRGQAARGAAAAPAHDVRPRDDQGDRLLPRHRELLAPPDRPRARASRRRRCSTTCRTTR